MKRRDWKAAIAAHEGRSCRICGRPDVELHHVSGRRTDKPKSPGSQTLWVNPNAVVPLCGPVGDPASCHHRVERGETDLLPHLLVHEQVQAVADLGGIEQARIRLCPSAYEGKVAV